ncbi:MAG: RNA polymerase factor sigma-54 [Campylobacterales bacterium]|nr:RNA polymerase factor sigma-54 [Campylobacterales bacterium]
MSNNFKFYTKQKQSLQLSLKLWLPLLQSPLQELEHLFKEHSYENPFLKVSSTYEPSYNSAHSDSSLDSKGFIESMIARDESLYNKLTKQINGPLFPTPNSEKVAFSIIENINYEGYFEGNIEEIAIDCNTTKEFVESIRQRFAYLEPNGVGAKDLEESFLFQLLNYDIDDELNEFTKKVVSNLKKIDKYYKHHRFEESKNLIKKLNSPPAVCYLRENPNIIPDFFVEVGDDISLKINNRYYPDITVRDPFKTDSNELKEKLKEARNLVNLLELRKSTLYKLILIIVEKQIGFFIGSELKPLTMADVAEEIGFEESTISRAVANKYIKCERGVFSLKYFFTNAVSKDLSSSEIKNFITSLIKTEPTKEPLTDQDILDKVTEKYKMKMVRRTITKYRKILKIPSSKERKKIYKIS